MIPISSHICEVKPWGYTICGETVCAKCADSSDYSLCKIYFYFRGLRKPGKKCLQRKFPDLLIYTGISTTKSPILDNSSHHTQDSEQASLLWGSLGMATSGETLVSRLGDLQSFIGQRSRNNSDTGSTRRAT